MLPTTFRRWKVLEELLKMLKKKIATAKPDKHKLPDLQGLLAALSKIPPLPMSKTQGIS